MSFRHSLRAARFAALGLIAPLALLAAPHEARALIGSTPSTESAVYNNSGSPNFTQGATGCTSTSVSFDTNSFVTCNSGAWAVQPVQIGTASSAPFTCSSTYAGMMYENSGTNALQYCNGSSWTTLGTGVLYDNGTNVGIGTTSPVATLDVNGYAHLAKNSSQPIACDAAHDGSLALASTRRPCECVGSAWIDVVYGTACSW